ncbi:MAG: peptidylprolyl isomerase [Salinibacter sp.]|uniref:peptidylprolyl isomerase n=1 Tax=Salinibacter sp. TaxID=2065818 RepID=UPI0035D4214A
MAQAQEGDQVQVHYTGKLEDGTVFDESQEGEPLSFTIGEDRVIPGFEEAVTGMEPGDEKTTEVDPEQAYGEHREDMVMEMERGQIPDEVDPEVGQQLQLRLENGQTVPVLITALGEDTVTIDANHPLAGRKLIFDIEVLDVEEGGGSAGGGDGSNIVTP